jgi:exopolysaccharide biosynthesis WecB/TagA/CpsF family protein
MIFALLAHLVAAALLGAGCLMLASCLYLLTLAGASFLHHPRDRSAPERNRIVVLVPAHNEEDQIGRCLASLAQQTYPRVLRRVVVIADNCTDRTADVARAHGADVMVRDQCDTPGKGRALRWALDQLLATRRKPDYVVMVDADSVAEPDMLRHLAAELAAGADVAQADYRILDAESTGSRLVATGFLLFHRVRFAGRAALGLPANLVGNGMAFRREVLERLPWSAFTSVEDLEYSLMLRIAGVRPAFVAQAVVFGPTPQSRRALRRQRARWEGGRFYLLATWIAPLLGSAIRRRDWAALDAAVDLAILPTGLLALAVGIGFGITGSAAILGLLPAWVALPWALSVVALPAYVIAGLRAASAPRSAYVALLSTPGFLVRKLFLYVGLLLGFDPRKWESSAEGDSDDLLDPDGDGIAWIANVPVHVVDMRGAIDRVMDLVGRPGGGHVCTVNLDFVVSAQKNREVNGLLQNSDLNVPDGAPVAWLARLLGHRMPRVAGADLVPLVTARAAERGFGVFFLGGEGSAAEESARRLSIMYPALQVAGWYEPPRAALEDLPSAEIVRLIRDSGAAIVLVGLGHPKQERWIAQNRVELGSSVAIGVGGCFDFISARRRRAPRWVQSSGLEWLYRLCQEPRRLAGRYARDAGWLLVLTARVLRSRRGLLQRAPNLS